MTQRPLRVMLYLPTVREAMGGGGVAMWHVAEALESRGHEVRVANRYGGARTVRGRQVLRRPGEREFRWADVVLTTPAVALSTSRSEMYGAGVAVFVHSAVGGDWKPGRPRCDLIVWASRALRAAAVRRGYRGHAPAELVQWPILHAERYRAQPGERVTLVNLLPEKGAGIFWSLAERMPDVPFLAVHGGWGAERQQIPASMPPNVEVLPYQADPCEVYRRTRVLLYPRSADAGANWLNGVGMTALEAACSGIPTVAYPGPGLLESLGEGGNFCESFDPADWEVAVRSVLADWPARSRAALAVADRLDPERQAEEIVAALRSIARRPMRVPRGVRC